MSQIGELWIGEVNGHPAVGVGEPRECIPSSAVAVRARVRFGGDGRYRPLTGARNLPKDWYVFVGAELPLEAAIEAVYPLAMIHRRQLAGGSLRVVTLDNVLGRQSGRYEGAGTLSGAGRGRIRNLLCDANCVRVPVWDGATPGDGIPCPEPCSVLVALAREAAFWEHELPLSAEPNPAVEFADFETPGNVVRETYLRRAREETST